MDIKKFDNPKFFEGKIYKYTNAADKSNFGYTNCELGCLIENPIVLSYINDVVCLIDYTKIPKTLLNKYIKRLAEENLNDEAFYSGKIYDLRGQILDLRQTTRLSVPLDTLSDARVTEIIENNIRFFQVITTQITQETEELKLVKEIEAI